MLQEGRRTQDVVGCKLWKTGPWICQWRISTERPRQRHSSKAWARESQRMDSTGDCELRKAGDLTRANCNFPGQLLLDFTYGKLADKITNIDYVTEGCCSCYKCKPLGKQSYFGTSKWQVCIWFFSTASFPWFT